MSLGERPRGSARPTPNEHYNSLPKTSIEGALVSVPVNMRVSVRILAPSVPLCDLLPEN